MKHQTDSVAVAAAPAAAAPAAAAPTAAAAAATSAAVPDAHDGDAGEQHHEAASGEMTFLIDIRNDGISNKLKAINTEEEEVEKEEGKLKKGEEMWEEN